MIDSVKKTLDKFSRLSSKEQERIAKIIEKEMAWANSFEESADALTSLANEAEAEYKTGKTEKGDW